jgi:hypothetical protein
MIADGSCGSGAARYRLDGETIMVLKIWHSLEDRPSGTS